MNKQVIVDYIGSLQFTPEQINESIAKNEGKLIVSGVMQRGSTGDDKNFNQNGRSYPLPILKREADKYKSVFVKEHRALGELDHPESSVVNLGNVSHNVVDLWWEGTDLMGKIEILPTPSGNIAKELLKSGIRLGISSRGMGSVKNLGEGKVEVQDDFEFVCWDLVSNPSTQGAFMDQMNESVGTKTQTNKYTKVNSLISDIISIM
jgi:hypothetical protein